MLDLPQLSKDKYIDEDEEETCNIFINTSSSSHRSSPTKEINEPLRIGPTPPSSLEHLDIITPLVNRTLFDASRSKAVVVPPTSTWLENTLSKKRKVIKLYLPKQDMLSQLIQRTHKPKRLKTTSKLVEDDRT